MSSVVERLTSSLVGLDDAPDNWDMDANDLQVGDFRALLALVAELTDVLPLIDFHEDDTRLNAIRAALQAVREDRG